MNNTPPTLVLLFVVFPESDVVCCEPVLFVLLLTFLLAFAFDVLLDVELLV